MNIFTLNLYLLCLTEELFEFLFEGLWCFALAGCVKIYGEELLEIKVVPVFLTTISGILVFFTLLIISYQPVSEKKLSFAVRNNQNIHSFYFICAIF